MPRNLQRVIFIETAIVLLIGAFDMPFAFYGFVRGVTAISGGLLIYSAIKHQKLIWTVPGALAIILFAAGFGFQFPKESWILIDLFFSLIFLAAGISFGKTTVKTASPEEMKLGLAIAIVSGVFLLLFTMLGTGGDTSSCPNWVQDSHGGYCET
jgi:hypothetical protein